MKRITKQETLPALAVPEVLSVPELAYPARLGKRQFYKRIVASELKRQLAVVNGKLDNLQAQNEALRAELARLKQEK